METKRCTKCDEIKSLKEYAYKNKQKEKRKGNINCIK